MRRATSSDSTPLKRSLSDAEGEEDAEPSSSMFLQTQNKALSIEMKKYKRQISQARKELDLMRRKSREMEALVSVIQRAWSQLDIDSSLLLDGLGDSEMFIQDSGSSELLSRLLSAGTSFLKSDPTIAAENPEMIIDEWSTSEEVEAERRRCTAAVEQASPTDASDSPNETGIVEYDGSSELQEHLISHASFTMSLLERLCVAISETAMFERAPEMINAIAEAKSLHAERFSLIDKITKLTTELIDVRAKLHVASQQKARAERAVSRSQEEISQLKVQCDRKGSTTEDGITPDGVATSSSSSSSSSTSGATSKAASSALEAEYRAKLTVLEKHLAESEGAKAKVEMTLTERLARPLSQMEAQISDMRKSMEELRLQCRQRVAILVAEGNNLQDKVSELEVAMMDVEEQCDVKMKRLVLATQQEISKIRTERNDIETKLNSAKAELSLTSQLKLQVDEYQTLASSSRLEISTLRERVTALTAVESQLTKHLAASRGREDQLNTALESLRQQQTTSAAGSSSSASSSSSSTSITLESAVDISTPITDGDDRPKTITLLLAPNSFVDDIDTLNLHQARQRTREAVHELENARANVDDLIMEIEAVTADEKKVRDQSTRLLGQMSDSQSMQRGVLEENLKLNDQVSEMQTKLYQAESRVQAITNVLKQQDAIITQLKQSDQGTRTELHTVQKSSGASITACHVDKDSLLEAQQKLSVSELSVEAALKRNHELQGRCDELANQWEVERKLRMEAQRVVRPKKKEKTSADAAKAGAANGGVSSEDAAMLEITLGMLRCSVCRDRFKEVAITRCFHLFCKECIDENLRNRHRKCPACGEKFGQDDVRVVYFTH